MARPKIRLKIRLVALNTKQKYGQPTKINSISKDAKKSKTSSFLSHFWLFRNSKQKISQLRNISISLQLFFNFPIFSFLF